MSLELYRIYYTEINTVCIVILILLYKTYMRRNTGSVKSVLYMRLTLFTGMCYCLSDIGAAVFRGAMFPGAQGVLYFFNCIYILTGVLISYFWLLYTNEELDRAHKSDRIEEYVATGIVAVSVSMIVTTPWTGLTFVINEQNLYNRGPLIFVHWITSGVIMLVPTVKSFITIGKSERKSDKDHAKLMASFIIAPIICYALQNIFYGITTIQVGYTVSALLVILRLQAGQITKDGLTGLNNRSAFDYHIDDVFRSSAVNTGLIMVDLDDFKKINEEVGHLEGDNIMQDFGEAVKNTCKRTGYRVFASRYGGDEFAFLFTDCTEEMILDFIDVLQDEVILLNQKREINLTYCEGHVLVFNRECEAESLIKETYDIMNTKRINRKTKVQSQENNK